LPKNPYSQFHSDAIKGPKLDRWQAFTWKTLQKTPVKYNPLSLKMLMTGKPKLRKKHAKLMSWTDGISNPCETNEQ